jgi:hypothetical protein
MSDSSRVHVRVSQITASVLATTTDGSRQLEVNLLPCPSSAQVELRGQEFLKTHSAWCFDYTDPDRPLEFKLTERIRSRQFQELATLTVPLTWFPPNTVVQESFPMNISAPGVTEAVIFVKIHRNENNGTPFQGRLSAILPRMSATLSFSIDHIPEEFVRPTMQSKSTSMAISDAQIVFEKIAITDDDPVVEPQLENVETDDGFFAPGVAMLERGECPPDDDLDAEEDLDFIGGSQVGEFASPPGQVPEEVVDELPPVAQNAAPGSHVALLARPEAVVPEDEVDDLPPAAQSATLGSQVEVVAYPQEEAPEEVDDDDPPVAQNAAPSPQVAAAGSEVEVVAYPQEEVLEDELDAVPPVVQESPASPQIGFFAPPPEGVPEAEVDDVPPVMADPPDQLLFPPPPVQELRRTASLDVEQVNVLDQFSFFPTHEQARSPYVPPPFLPICILPLED